MGAWWSSIGRRGRTALDPIAPMPTDDAALPEIDDAGATFLPFRPTFGLPDTPFVREIEAAPTDGALIDLGVPGFLRREEALKLYELSYHVGGDVLEFGTAWGLSTMLLATAKRDRGSGRVVSVELDPSHARAARANLATRGLGRYASVVIGDAAAVARRLRRRGRRFAFVFVDHDHGGAASRQACADVAHLVPTGGLVLFHDLNDARNRDGDYGVHAAVEEVVRSGLFRPVGAYGSALLVQRTEQDPVSR